jgi:CBS domain containing-hemolysin-like protein
MEEDPNLIIYLALLGLLILSAFFSAVEVAFITLSPAKVRVLADKKTSASKLIVKLKSRPQRLLATVLIGNNTVNIFAAGLATMVATEVFGHAGLGIATGVMTFLILIFGEIFPKAYAQKHAEKLALFAAFPLYYLERIISPLTFILEKVLHALGMKHTERVTEAELVALVGLGVEGGELKKHEEEMIQNVLEFTDTKVEEVMIPRVEIEAIEKSKTVAEAEAFFRDGVYSRLPVYDNTIDKVIGVLTIRQIFEFQGDANLKLEKLPLLQPIFTPASRPIRSLFQEFKSRHTHLAIVVDEHGGTSGLVTLEDLLEEIVGEIEDEEDVSQESIQRVNSKTLLVDGDTLLWEIDKRLKTKLASGKYEGKTVAFLLLDKLGKMPHEDAKIRAGNAELTIEEVESKRIAKVKIEKI